MANFISFLLEAFKEPKITGNYLYSVPSEEEMHFGSAKHQYFSDSITPTSLPANIRASLKDYTSSSALLNTKMWDNSLGKTHIVKGVENKTDHVRNILRGISSFNEPLPENMTVYSGLRSASNPPTNSISHHPSFTSTSLDPRVAFSFASKQSDGSHHIIAMELPEKSQHGIYIKHLSTHPEEEEYLLGANKILHYYKPATRISTDGGDVTIHHAKILDENDFHLLPDNLKQHHSVIKNQLQQIHDMPSEAERAKNASQTNDQDLIHSYMNDTSAVVRNNALNNPNASNDTLKKAIMEPRASINLIGHVLRNNAISLSDDEISHFIKHSNSPALITQYGGGLKPKHQEELFNRNKESNFNMYSLSKLNNLEVGVAHKIMNNNIHDVVDVLDNHTINLSSNDIEDIIDKHKKSYHFDSIFSKIAENHVLSKKAINMAADIMNDRKEDAIRLADYCFPSIIGNNNKTGIEAKKYLFIKAMKDLPDEFKQDNINRLTYHARNMGIDI